MSGVASVAVARSGGARLPPLPTIRDIIKIYKLRALKQLSQNFIMDERLTDKIVKVAGNILTNDVVLEVGPGPGNITRSILKKTPSKLILVEKDRRFMPSLELLKVCAEPMGTQIDIYHGDILNFSMDGALPPGDQTRIHLIGNLPFAISTRLLVNWLQDISLRQGAFRRTDTTMTLTFQQEVADRICAAVGHPQRCRLSIISQIWTQPEMRFTIPGSAFVPKPEVNVGVVRLKPLREPKTDMNFNLVEKVVRHIFSMRQKYCRRGFATLFPPEIRDDVTHALFSKTDVSPTARPFQLSVNECLQLARVYKDYIDEYPEIALYDHRAPKIKLENDSYSET